MSRSGYSDDCSGAELNLWRGAVESSIRGKRGQAFLREMLAALDALPEKRLATSVLVEDGECCAMGAVALKRGLSVDNVDPECREMVADLFGISEALAAEIAYMNDDEDGYSISDEKRWLNMRRWVESRLRPETP